MGSKRPCGPAVLVDRPAAAWPHSGPRPDQQWLCWPDPSGPCAAGTAHGAVATRGPGARSLRRRRAECEHGSLGGVAGSEHLAQGRRCDLHRQVHGEAAHPPGMVTRAILHRRSLAPWRAELTGTSRPSGEGGRRNGQQ
jgi:hypothetical protein